MSSARLMRAARSLQADDSVLKQTVTPGTAMRMLKFSRACAGLLSIFLVIVVVDAIVGIINPLLYRDIINNGILKGDSALIIKLTVLVGQIAERGTHADLLERGGLYADLYRRQFAHAEVRTA